VGDFEDVERLQGGIRDWLTRSARNGRHELRGIQAPEVLPLLCAAAFVPELAGSEAVSGIGVLSSVRADALAGVLADAVARAGSGPASGAPSRGDLQREVSRGIGLALEAQDERAGQVRSDIAMVLREIDAGGDDAARRDRGRRPWARAGGARRRGGGERRVRRDGVHAG
jgi:hypothetical protein